jgi:hypothetical protein
MMADIGNKFGAVVPLVKDTAWWTGTDITLYKGEIAWELKTAGGAVAEAYMLVGDGLAVNPNHLRLRVSGDNIIVNFAGGKVTINAALQTITQQYNNATAKYNEIIAAFSGVLTANNIRANSISFPASQGSNAPTYIDQTKVKSPRVETAVGVIQTANIGTATVTGNEVVQGTLSAATASLTTAQVSGNETVGGALTVTGKITGSNGLEVSAGQTTLKNTQVNGTLGATSAAVSGNETVGGTLGVTGKITGSNGLEVANGQTTLKNTQVNGTLGATSAAVSGNETVGGLLTAQNLQVPGNASIQGTLSFTNANITGVANIGGTLGVTGKITGSNGLEVSNGQTTLKNTQVNGSLGAQSAAVSGNETVGGTLGVTGKITGSNGLEVTAGQTTLRNTQIAGTLNTANVAISGNISAGGSISAGSAIISGNESVGGSLNVTGRITGNGGLDVINGQTTLKNTLVNGTLTAQSAAISGGTASLSTLNAVTAVLQSLTTQAATLHGVSIIDEVRTALAKNPNGQRVLLQWASGNLTLGNLLDHLRLTSSLRPLVQDSGGTHEVAYLDDLIGNILFQFSVYSIGASQTNLPPVNPARPPALNEKAIVKAWSGNTPAYVKWNGTAWVYDSLLNKPDNYAWEWVVKNYRDSANEHYSAVFVIYSHEETWSIVDIPLELYRPFAEQNVIDNNAKEWIRFANNFIPDWLARATPRRITSADTGANGAGAHPPDTDKSGLILNKPPILSDLYGMNIIDGGDEESEAFNQENWGNHAWGYIVDGGDETYAPVFRYHIDGGNERFLPFWNNRVYPTIAGAA